MPDFKKLTFKIASLSLLAGLKEDEGVKALAGLCELPKLKKAAVLWGNYYRALCEKGCENDTMEYFKRLICTHENEYSRRVAAGKDAKAIEFRMTREIAVFNELAEIKPEDFVDEYDVAVAELPDWRVGLGKPLNIHKLKDEILSRGYGVFAESVAYFYDERTGELRAIKNLDPVRLSDLKLYDDCKETVVQNTLDFIDGLPANNVLLYGDRGTGKSSTVHAVLNEYAGRGLRLVEIQKSAISDFGKVLNKIENLGCFRFIIFIDDLSFADGTDDFARLKAALEGSAHALENVLIYATSNRRHLVRERYESGDEISVNDTVQEQMSLSDRFGIIVSFFSPDKREFIKILEGILSDRGITLPKEQLALEAERYALGKGGRSGRAARQLADIIESRLRRSE